jgi:hypothetical protein
MSTIFNVRIELVVGPKVWSRFEVCHPVQWNVPSTKSIALLVVVEAYDNMKRGFGFSAHRQPISREEAVTLISTHAQQSKLERWLELYNRFDGKSFATEADEAILDVQLANEDGNPKINDGDPHPKATLVFTVKDEAILAHIVGGFYFGSAICDCRFW